METGIARHRMHVTTKNTCLVVSLCAIFLAGCILITMNVMPVIPVYYKRYLTSTYQANFEYSAFREVPLEDFLLALDIHE